MPDRRRDLLVHHLPAAVWLLLTTVALALPSNMADLPEWVPRWLHFQALDKVIHAFLFLGTGLLLARSLRRFRGLWKPLLVAFLLAAAYGAATEVAQGLFTDRDAEVLDAVADAAGAAVGVLLAAAAKAGL